MSTSLPIEAHFCTAATATVEKLAKKKKMSAAHLLKLVQRAQELGWDNAVKVQLIKVLDNAAQIGEIRQNARGGHRAIFFWDDDATVRSIHITDVPEKSILKPVRLQTYIDSAIERRNEFLSHGAC